MNLIFDKNLSETVPENSTSPVNDEIDVKDCEEENSSEILKSKQFEIDGVKLTEAGKLEEALSKFNESIRIAENRPSPYNNRAQLYRFMEKDDRKDFFEDF